MKQNNAVPLALLIAGLVGALYCAYMCVFETETYVIAFAIACIVAVLGWHELIATDEIFETQEGE
jgi:hypothetical protein